MMLDLLPNSQVSDCCQPTFKCNVVVKLALSSATSEGCSNTGVQIPSSLLDVTASIAVQMLYKLFANRQTNPMSGVHTS